MGIRKASIELLCVLELSLSREQTVRIPVHEQNALADNMSP